MAYQFADGFDNYGNSFSLANGYPWDLVQGSTVINTDFRFTPPNTLPGGCVTMTGTQNLVRKNLSSNQSTLFVGFGLKLSALPGAGLTDLCDFWNAGAQQLGLAVNSVGALQFYRGTGSTLGGGFSPVATAIGSITPNGTIVAGTWYGLLITVTIGTGTAGSVKLLLNGNQSAVINNTNINTSGDGSAFSNQVSIGPSVTNIGTVKFDDFFCFDTTGSFLNAAPTSDTRILTKMPSGVGNYTNWTPNGLGSNFQNAAVQPPNTADFNANNVATTKDSYAMQSASLGVAPYFVVTRASMERDDAGPHTPSLFVRSGSTDSSGTVTPALTSSYLFYDAVFQNDPATSALWTASGADNAQAGVIEG